MSMRLSDVAGTAQADTVRDEPVIRSALAHVLASPHFIHAPRLSRFLRYIVDESLAGRADGIKEYALAADVFGRGDDYDSSTDAIVRVEAGRLRSKLRTYYDTDGRDAPLEIELPKGSYVPHFRARASVTLHEVAVPRSPTVRQRGSPAWYVVVLLLGLVVIGAVGILRRDVVVPGRIEAAGSSHDALAVDAFLKGQYLRNQMTLASIREAAGWFARAVERDDSYAAAWAALGEARATLVFHDAATSGTSLEQARRDIERALALSPSLGEARGVVARIRLTSDFDWTRAEPDFRQALADAPDNARLHQWFAFALASRGRFGEALEESRRATVLNPSAYVGTTDAAMLLFFARRYSEALDAARQAHGVNARMSVAHVVAGMCLGATGRHAEAVEEYTEAVEGDVTFTAVHAKLAHAYGAMGKPAAARAAAEALTRAFAPHAPPAVDRALVQIGLGNLDAAMSALEAGLDAREGDLLFIDVNPLLDPLRANPRFAALRRRAGM